MVWRRVRDWEGSDRKRGGEVERWREVEKEGGWLGMLSSRAWDGQMGWMGWMGLDIFFLF